MANTSTTPLISCITTAYNEGPLAATALNALLAQTMEDFEILLVDDGASEETRETLHRFDDPRVVHIRQANDGLSSARNRALNVARGDYVCFLDADDTRPPWAFQHMIDAAGDGVDVVFSPGLLSEVRNEITPFYDQPHFDRLRAENLTSLSKARDHKIWKGALRHLACIEPQCANKMVRREFIEAHKLRFPAGLFFEDMIFHFGLLTNMESYAITSVPTFTYFRRYGRPQITSGTSLTRFDAISTATNALDLFSLSEQFHDVVFRNLVLAAAMKLVMWCEDSVSYDHKYAFRQAIRTMLQGLSPRYLEPVPETKQAEVYGYAPWVQPSLEYVLQAK